MEKQDGTVPYIASFVGETKKTMQTQRQVIILGGDHYARFGEVHYPSAVIDQDVAHLYQHNIGKLNIHPRTVAKPNIEEVISKCMVDLLRRGGVPLRAAK